MIYAISDIHGDKKQAVKLLQKHGVIDNDDKWIAGSSTLVVNGDSTDRGSDGIGTLRFFFNLTKEAESSGGRVIHTMGNHDALILCMALHSLNEDYNYEHTYIIKLYLCIDPDGIEHITNEGLAKFCEERNLTRPNMVKVANGQRPQHKGWTCQRL
jgi:hypothetical protein